MISDAAIGKLLHTVNTLFFVYWLLWVAVTPFVDVSHFTQNFFPPREYGIAIPVVLVSVLVVVAITVSSVHIIRRTGLTDEVRKRRIAQLEAIAAAARAQQLVGPRGGAGLGVVEGGGTSPRNQRLSSPPPMA
jgi:dolichol phosphate-mannose biosynthesis regulatory protein